jgi:hypothetical protein
MAKRGLRTVSIAYKAVDNTRNLRGSNKNLKK